MGRGATEGKGEQSYELMDHYAPEIEAMLKIAETRAQQKGYSLSETKPAKFLNCSHDETGRMHSWEERFMRIGPMYAFDNVDKET